MGKNLRASMIAGTEVKNAVPGGLQISERAVCGGR